jgi:hypothetical protein
VERLAPLTAGEVAALQGYAAKHGRTWKSKLRDAWMGGRVDEGGTLRRLRNTHGPSWLVGYRLPKAEG